MKMSQIQLGYIDIMIFVRLTRSVIKFA